MGQGRPEKLGWMPLWYRDFMADPEVQALSWEQRGRYLWALMCSWDSATPGVAKAAQWLRWMGTGLEDALGYERLFRIDGDVWTQKRLADEHRIWSGLRDRRKYISQLGHQARWGGQKLATCIGEEKDGCISFSSPGVGHANGNPDGNAVGNAVGNTKIAQVLVLPSKGRTWVPTAVELTVMRAAYPQADLPAEFAKMRAWLVANGLKTEKGTPRFANAWLSRSVANGNAPSSPSSPSPWDQEPRRA